MRHSRLGKLQPAQAKRNHRRREDDDFTQRENAANARDRVGEALACLGLIGCMHQAGCEIAGFGDVNLGERIVAFVEFIQLPLRSRGVQMRHALPRQGQRALRQNRYQPFHDAPILVCEAAGVEPKKPAGQCAVYRGLRFLGVHPDHGQRPLSLLQESAQVRWSERAMQVHGGGEAGHGPSGKVALQGTLPAGGICDPRGLPRCGRAPVAIAVEVDLRRSILPHALHLQPERAAFYFCVQHTAHNIALMRPQMQQAFVVLARDGILRLRQVEGNSAVFDH